MNKLIVGVLFLIGISIGSSNAQTAFDKAMREVHISAVTTCGMVKSKDHNRTKILKGFQDLKDQIADIQEKYVDNPPAEYAKDALFASYFVQFNEIINSQVTLVKNENYKVAAMNCVRFCMAFHKMHVINGQIELSDMMFARNMQITMTQFMVNAGNLAGAQQNMKQIPMFHNKVLALKAKRNDVVFNRAFGPVDTLYKSWLSAVENKDYKKATEIFNNFSTSFPKVFKQSI